MAQGGMIWLWGRSGGKTGGGRVTLPTRPTLPPMWSPEPVPAQPQFSTMRLAMLAVGAGAVR